MFIHKIQQKRISIIKNRLKKLKSKIKRKRRILCRLKGTEREKIEKLSLVN